MPLYPVENDYYDPFKLPPANRISIPGTQTLYRSSTGFEKALADTDAERLMDMYAEAIIDVWNPWQIAYEHLPFLAWATGVNLWEFWWDETFRRSWVARQWYLKSIRGKRAGLDEFVAAVGGHVKRCIVPPARAYGTKAMTDEERAAYVARFPQLRIYPYVAREQLPWLCYCGKHYNGTGQKRVWNKNGAFLGPRWRLYPTIQNAGGKYTRTATLYDPRTGEETVLTIRRIERVLTGEGAGWGFTPGVSQYDESVILPLEHRPAYFIREPRKYLGFNVYLGEALPLRTISIGRSGPLDLVQGKAQYQTVFPQEEQLQLRPEYVAIKHLRRKTELYAARGEYLIGVNFLHSHFAAGGFETGPPVFGRAVLEEFAARSLVTGSPQFSVPAMAHRVANYDIDTSAWIMVTEAWSDRQISTARRVLVDNFIVGLKSNNLWSKYDRLHVFAAEDIYGALIDLKRRHPATVNGSPYFTADRGFTNIGAAGYIGLDYRFIVDGEQYTQNTAHLSCWNLTDGTNVLPTLVGNGAGGHENIYAKYTDGKALVRVNDNPDTAGFAVGDCRGLLLGSRNGTARTAYLNGVSIGAYAGNNSQTPSNLELVVLTREVAAVSVGGPLSAAEQLIFYNLLRTYMAALNLVAGVTALTGRQAVAGTPALGAPTLVRLAGTNALTATGAAAGSPTFSVPAVVVLAPVLLLHFEGADASTTFIDSSPAGHVLTPTGVEIDTARVKIGSGSALFAGTLDLDGSSNFAFGTGDFTIDFWLLQSTTSGTRYQYDSRPTTGTVGMYPVLRTVSAVLQFFVNGAVVITGSTLTFNTWWHIALTRALGTTRLFVNGAQVGGDYADSNDYIIAANRPRFGSFVGSLDEVRVIKGYAVWTSDFTPPTSPYP